MAKPGRKTKQQASTNRIVVAAALAAVAVGVGLVLLSGDGGPADGGDAAYTPVTGFPDVHGLAVNPERPHELFVATHHGLIRAVNDSNWARVGASQDDLMGFTMHPTDGDVMWVSGHPAPAGGNMGVRQSTDGGLTWSTIALEGEVDFHALTVSPVDPDRLWGIDAGRLLASEDGGREWRVVNAGPLNALGLTPDPTDAQVLYAALPDGIRRSTNGGATWSAPMGVPAAVIAIDRNEPDVWFVGDGEGVLRSADGGATWTRLGLDAEGSVVGYLAIDPTDSDVVYAATYSAAIHKSEDGGETWVVVKAAER